MHCHSRYRVLCRAIALLAIGCGVIGGSIGGPARAQSPSPGTPDSAAIHAPAHDPAHDPASCVVAPRPNSLWSLAQCCSRNLHSNPGCRTYDATDEYIILKDNSRRKPAAYLIIPTIRVTGVDDKQIFAPPVVDFWEYGWRAARHLVDKPAAATALAINSTRGRTQNQFHIHIACALPAVAQTLADNAGKIGSDPASAVRLALGPANHPYRVIKVTSALVGADSPFNLVAAMPGVGADMGDQSIAVVGSATPGSYYVLDTAAEGANPGAAEGANPGAAEELLDQTCRE